MRSLLNIADRLWVGFGFVSRSACLLLTLLLFLVLAFVRFGSGGLANGLSTLVLTLLVIGALIAWLLRTGTKHYRTWGVIGLAFGMCVAMAPCWVPEFPAQDFPTPGAADQSFPYTLRQIHAAETRFHAQFGRYGALTEIRTVDGYRFDKGPGPWQPYRIKIAPGRDTYQLTAEPAHIEGGYPCCIGCPRQRFFYGDETGILRSNNHCRPADAHSLLLK